MGATENPFVALTIDYEAAAVGIDEEERGARQRARQRSGAKT